MSPQLTPSRRAAISLTALLVVAAVTLSVPRFAMLYPSCPIHHALGLLCPGCGGTHALAALLHGHPAQAFHRNPLLTVLLPFALLYTARLLRNLWQNASPAFPPVARPAMILLFVLTAAFTVARNLPQ